MGPRVKLSKSDEEYILDIAGELMNQLGYD
jgi:hypothetical protein